MNNVIVGMIKVIPRDWEPEVNLANLARLVAEMAAKGAQLIITPESFVDGYVVRLRKRQDDWSRERFRALCQQWAQPALARIRQIARDNNVYLVAGMSEPREDGLCNSAYLIDPAGEILGRYDKIQPCEVYQPGQELPVFETEFGTVAMTICADRRWPEIIRALAVKGARAILMPTYGMKGTPNDLWMRTRSYENGVWICFTHPTESLITDPAGEIAARLVAADTEYLLHTLDLAAGEEHREEMLGTRHPEVYGFTWETDQTADRGR